MTQMMIRAAGPRPADLLARFRVAQTLKSNWESIWQDCLDYTFAQRQGINGAPTRNMNIFDGTTADAVDQLAASLLAQLTPPWSSWIAVAPGPAVNDAERAQMAPGLRAVNEILQGHFDRSNFTVETHQAFLDLVTLGTACLRFDETAPGAVSAFQFSAMPINSMSFLDTVSGQLDTAFCRLSMTGEEILVRFPHAAEQLSAYKNKSPDHRYSVLYAATPQAHGGTVLSFLLEPDDNDPVLLEQVTSNSSPFIAFRWQKSAGEIYGRSPVMKALPDIKTANKVVELTLKNASIAVTGIWLADDDGILNPANIKLVPGAIIPKAVGSAGLTPLKMPGSFDISQLVLGDLRQKITQALLGDRIVANNKQMTATEIIARQADIAQTLGATYGRLQSELLTPLAICIRVSGKRRSWTRCATDNPNRNKRAMTGWMPLPVLCCTARSSAAPTPNNFSSYRRMHDPRSAYLVDDRHRHSHRNRFPGGFCATETPCRA